MEPDYDDPATEDQWCNDRRVDVVAYLAQQNVVYSSVGEWPAWHIAPHVSVWAVESHARPGWLGWWVICGDLPTDYVSADAIKHPRDAMRAIGHRWSEAALQMAKGIQPPEFRIGPAEEARDLSPLLESRASILISWANDDSLWDPDAL